MGKTRINNREIVTPAPQMPVRDLKELAGIPAHEVVYDQAGHVLDNNQIVPTDDTQYGSVTDWVRG
ncbi:MAG: hypothetical protein RLZZ580_2930 [Cyanobacteriota bacterium]|jgi:hypothetical protein|nr:hypothetical protein [Microcystis aeruginosa SX13-01]